MTKKPRFPLVLVIFLTLFTLGASQSVNALVKGIYLTQTTLENTKYLEYLIERSKKVGITTFVVDLEAPSSLYQKNINLLKQNGIQYVARVIVFPNGGGTPAQVTSQSFWEKRYKLVEAAIAYGAHQIQLDYIRYQSKQPASPENAKNVLKVVQYFRNKTKNSGVTLQADVFGISSYGESQHIGQNLKLMAEHLDALCPMVYPSHYEPFREHAKTPYTTIFKSLKALQSQFGEKMPIKLYAYIEISNYRYPLNGETRRHYVLSEMKAVHDAKADGFYVWSAHNKYDYLFDLLAKHNDESIGKYVVAEESIEKTTTPNTPHKKITENTQQPLPHTFVGRIAGYFKS